MTVELAHDVAGSGPLLVLVHGITENRRTWDPLVDPLAEHFRVVRLDLRGHGESPAASSYGQDQYAADVAELVEHVGGGEAPLLIGHSLGGLIASVYAARHPVRAVINIDQPLNLVPLQAAVKNVEPALRGDGTAAVMTALFDSMRGSLPAAENDRLVALRRPEREVVLGTWSLMLDSTPEQLGEAIDQLLDGIAVPYLALHGIDPGPDYATWLRQRIADAGFEVWDGAGHHPHLTEPDRFVARVLDLAADVPAVSADSI